MGRRAVTVIAVLLLAASIGTNILLARGYSGQRAENERFAEQTKNQMVSPINTTLQYLQEIVPGLEAALEDESSIEQTWGSVEYFLRVIYDYMGYIASYISQQYEYAEILNDADGLSGSSNWWSIVFRIRGKIADGEELSDILLDAYDFSSALLESYEKGYAQSEDIAEINYIILSDIEENSLLYDNFYSRY